MWRIAKGCLIPLLVICLESPLLGEVTIAAGTDRDSLTVGDRVTLRIRIRRTAGDVTQLHPPPGFPDPFEIVERKSPVLRTQGDEVEETIDFILAAYIPGEQRISPFLLRYQIASGDSGTVQSRPVGVTVHSLLGEGREELRAAKPPVEISGEVPTWLYVLLICFVGAIGALFWWMAKRNRMSSPAPEQVVVNWAAEIDRIARMGLLDRGEHKLHYSLLSEVTRRFLEDRFGVEAMERTTLELTRDLRGANELELEEVQQLESFLGEADLVKFAKFTPRPDHAKSRIPELGTWVSRVLERQKALSEKVQPHRDES